MAIPSASAFGHGRLLLWGSTVLLVERRRTHSASLFGSLPPQSCGSISRYVHGIHDVALPGRGVRARWRWSSTAFAQPLWSAPWSDTCGPAAGRRKRCAGRCTLVVDAAVHDLSRIVRKANPQVGWHRAFVPHGIARRTLSKPVPLRIPRPGVNCVLPRCSARGCAAPPPARRGSAHRHSPADARAGCGSPIAGRGRRTAAAPPAAR